MTPYRDAADACRAAHRQAITDRQPYSIRHTLDRTALLCDLLALHAREAGEEEK